ncbi:LPS export ABC transporter permease LptF [Nereida sp. MMG025]|uniref:LPS export ABC transporter permease LptF n=1 Tax=Nereida sp. MMG025 TaxID=2909981 RepID=UPI001F0081AA|nr:LPS export ABC transporter permease LptF [Nereida sp. MMG025]MCF6443442.1 LPS export ABC transporter permease LptF [Nereida sp. MMG025]
MPRFDRYLLSQLMVVFGFFSLVLVFVYWINRAVVLFDQLIADGQSAVVFLEFTALTLPNAIRLVLPIAAVAASIYVTNRMSSESELVVVQATGFSPYRMARPIITFGVTVALLLSVLTHFLVPISSGRLADRTSEISQNVTARLLSEGRFQHPTDGVTIYIREVTSNGELKGLFLSDNRTPDRRVTYTARSALLVRSDTGPKLVMFDGQAQALTVETRRLSITSFSDFAYDIGGLIDDTDDTARSFREMPTIDLINPSPAILAEANRTRGTLVQEGHSRFTQPLFALVGALIGFATLMVGSFSRFGVWRQVNFAVFLIIALKLIENKLTDQVETNPDQWMLMYLPTGLGLAAAYGLLWLSTKPTLFVRRKRGMA